MTTNETKVLTEDRLKQTAQYIAQVLYVHLANVTRIDHERLKHAAAAAADKAALSLRQDLERDGVE